MASRVIAALMMIFAIGFITACVDSACPEPARYLLKDIKTHAFDSNAASNGQIEYYTTDTLVNQLAFETVAQIEFAMNRKQNASPFGLMGTAYGCIDNELLNPIQPEFSSFSCNQDILVRDATLLPPNDCISPHTNLLQDERIKDFIEFPKDLSLENEAITRVNRSSLSFASGDYTFYFKWVTSDGIELTDSIQVYLNF